MVRRRDDEIPRHRSRKNRRRWCKGIIGRAHDYIWVEWKELSFDRDNRVYSIEECRNCRKQRTGLFGWANQYGPAF